MEQIVSKTDLARKTREIVDQVRSGQTVIVQSYGHDEVVLLDALDYRLLKAFASYAVTGNRVEYLEARDNTLDDVVRAYRNEQISLAKAAELLGLSRFELMDRFERLGIPLRMGPATLDEARAEVSAAQRGLAE